MLTLGIRCTCIILRHIPSWFEAVLAIAILQSCAQGGPKWPFWGQKWPNMAGLPRSKSGLKGSEMIPNDQYNRFLTIWGHFGIIWALLDHLTQTGQVFGLAPVLFSLKLPICPKTLQICFELYQFLPQIPIQLPKRDPRL